MQSPSQRTILLTGATGFLGSRLALALYGVGYRVIALVRSQSTSPRLDSLRPVASLYPLDQPGWEKVFSAHQIDAVVHTATCYGRTGETVEQVFAANTQLPLHLLSTAVEHGVGLFINTDTPLPRQINAYALSKAQFVEWGTLMKERTGFVNLRVESLYGPGEDVSKFVARTIRNCLDNAPHLDLTGGEQQRDFVFIDDVTSAFIVTLEKHWHDRTGRHDYQVGSGQPVSIRSFVELAHRLCHSTTQLRFGALPYREHELFFAQADNSALRALGWECHTPLEIGLLQVIESERKQTIP